MNPPCSVEHGLAQEKPLRATLLTVERRGHSRLRSVLHPPAGGVSAGPNRQSLGVYRCRDELPLPRAPQSSPLSSLAFAASMSVGTGQSSSPLYTDGPRAAFDGASAMHRPTRQAFAMHRRRVSDDRPPTPETGSTSAAGSTRSVGPGFCLVQRRRQRKSSRHRQVRFQ